MHVFLAFSCGRMCMSLVWMRKAAGTVFWGNVNGSASLYIYIYLSVTLPLSAVGFLHNIFSCFFFPLSLSLFFFLFFPFSYSFSVLLFSDVNNKRNGLHSPPPPSCPPWQSWYRSPSVVSVTHGQPSPLLRLVLYSCIFLYQFLYDPLLQPVIINTS